MSYLLKPKLPATSRKETSKVLARLQLNKDRY
jgi:hypothetical protein